MKQPVSIAIETSCRLGGVALGLGEELVATADFDASARHGTQLVAALAELLSSAGLRPAELQDAYVSVGPGSFTGTRIGVTVARTLGQMVAGLRCVGVSSPAAVAEGATPLDWLHLGVVLDAREGLIHATTFARRGERIVPEAPAGVMAPAEFLAAAPRPCLLLGEGLAYHDLRADGVTVHQPLDTSAPPHLPTAANVWRVGRRLAREGDFTDALRLLPVYCRQPEAVRLWQRKHGVDAPPR
jgi:tRNA threonylcarbamoyladenosine biosynthesis protein TsaB